VCVCVNMCAREVCVRVYACVCVSMRACVCVCVCVCVRARKECSVAAVWHENCTLRPPHGATNKEVPAES